MENNFNEDFDDLFARDLANAGKDARPGPEAWPALSNRLDHAGKRRRFFLLPWFLLFALVASNAWLLWQWHTQQAAIDALRQAARVQSSQNLITEPHSTIIYDTVYRTIVMTRRVIDTHPNAEPIEKTHLGTMVQQTFPGISSQATTAPPTAVTENQHSQPNAPNTSPTQNNPENLFNNPPQAIEKADTALLQPGISPAFPIVLTNADTTSGAITKATQADETTLPAQPDTANQFIKPLRQPLRWRLGLSAGVLSTTKVTGLSSTAPLCATLRAELLFQRHWSIEAGLSYATYAYKIEGQYDDRIDVPPPPPPSGNVYYFRQFEGRMRHFMPSLAVHYRFRPDKPWSWYIGAGYSARLTLAEKAQCEYIEHGTLAINRYEAQVNVPDRGSMGLTQLGTECALSRRWLIFGEWSAMFDIGKGQRTYPMIAGQLGVKWLLK